LSREKCNAHRGLRIVQEELQQSKTHFSRIVLAIMWDFRSVDARRTPLAAMSCAFLCVVLSGCAKHHASRAPAQSVKPARVGSTEKGIASWYGEPYHGRRAASGEIFDMEQLTAAHRTLPFQTWVEVTNLKNGKHVDVRITDRGPFVDGRIIDLSRAAARKIDMVQTGTAPVKLKVIKAPQVISEVQPPETLTAPTEQDDFSVQAGAFRDRERADAFAASLLLFPAVRVVPPDESDQFLWKVWVGKSLTREAADSLVTDLKLLSPQAFLVEELRKWPPYPTLRG
jgi:rare lipoprotein A